MELNILDLFNRSENNSLTPSEINWLEAQVSQYPWFSLPHQILARQHWQRDTSIKEKVLLKASAYSLNRNLLKRYVVGSAILLPKIQVPEGLGEENAAQVDSEGVVGDKGVEVEGLVAEGEEAVEGEAGEVVVEGINAVEVDAGEVDGEGIEAVEIVAGEGVEAVEVEAGEVDAEGVEAVEVEAGEVVAEGVEAVEIETGEVVAEGVEAVEIETGEVVEQGVEAGGVVVEGIKAEGVEAEKVVSEGVEAAEVGANVEETDAEIEDSESSKAETNTTPEAANEVSQPSEPEVPEIAPLKRSPQINWGINMAINLRTMKYQRLSRMINVEMQKFAHKAKTQEAASTEEAPEEKPAAKTTRKSKSKPGTAKKAAKDKPSTRSKKTTAKPTSKSAPKTGSKSTAKSTSKTSPKPASKPKSPSKTTSGKPKKEPEVTMEELELPELLMDDLPPLPSNLESNPEVVSAEADTESNYEIGAFSSFSFLDAAESTEEDPEETADHALAPELAVGITRKPLQDKSEIIIEDDDRVLEISVSQEQYEKYFRQSGAPEVPVEEEGTAGEGNQQRLNSLIDRFIQNEPTLSKPNAYTPSTGNLAKASSIDRDDLVTETLAKIHAKQGNKAKAIKIYQRLSLLFPEKKAYFADQISRLK